MTDRERALHRRLLRERIVTVPRLTGRTVAVAAAMAVWAPTVASASPGQEVPSPADAGPIIEIDVDVATADVEDIGGALDDVAGNVDDRLKDLSRAEDTLASAEAELEEAESAVTATETRIDKLTGLSDEVVAQAFINPPSVGSVDAISTPSLEDLAVKQTLLNTRASEDAAVLEELAQAKDDLQTRREDEEDAAASASGARDEAAAELADLEDAVGQQTEFVAAVERRLGHGQTEAAMLAELDPDLAASLESDRDALAAELQDVVDRREFEAAMERLAQAERERQERERRERAAMEQAAREQAAAEAAAAPADLGAPSGSLATVNCPAGGSITVDSSLANNLTALLSDAAGAGIQLCGGGYRDPQQQIELRKQHCGTSQYAIYEMPSSQCSPPTARPGTSNHEQGLAIDFTCNGGGAISSQSSSCFTWLDANAANYGLYNLPSEPWHWSTDGT